ncbi:MAG: serine protease [Thermoanaerobaculales bacterium]
MSARIIRNLLHTAVVVIATGTAAAASSGLPPSALPGTKALESVRQMVMPRVDVPSLLAEDAVREGAGKPVAPRFAQSIPVSFTPDNSGTWETLADGSDLWRLRISSPGALSLSLGLAKFDLPAGAELWIHDTDGASVQGPYTADNRNAAGGLWTAAVLGEELVAELHLLAGTEDGRLLEISTVNHGYRFFGAPGTTDLRKQGTCNIDVVCPQGDPWGDQIRSVARITFTTSQGNSLCTAQLVNNTAEDDTPYLLTAQHCINASDVAPTIVTYWNFQSPTCGALSGGSLSQNQSGATFKASWSFDDGSDFALIELDQAPDPSFNVYFAGWDARDEIPSSVVAIHHPNGDEKAISFEDNPLTITSLQGDESPGDGNFLRVGDWNAGTTEPGSSGSCIFDQTSGLCVGTLTAGKAACGNDLPDWYGRMQRHFTGNGSPETRLSDWLDPLGSGALSLVGKNAEGTTTTFTWLIPAAASNTGVGTSVWKSEVAVVNSGAQTRNASVYFVADHQAWPGTLLSGPHAVAPGASLFIDDPLLAQAPVAGLIYVTVDGADTAAFSRLYNLNDNASTFGQGMPGILLDQSSAPVELILPLVHSGPDRFRTNVGLVQTSAGTYRVEISIYSATGGLLAQKSYTTASAWRQINDIFKNMGIGDLDVQGGWIRVALVSGSPAFWTTYAAVIDAQTDDPTYIQPVAP